MQGRATDIMLFLSLEKLFEAAKLATGGDKLEKAYRHLQVLLNHLQDEISRQKNNAKTIQDLEGFITQ